MIVNVISCLFLLLQFPTYHHFRSFGHVHSGCPLETRLRIAILDTLSSPSSSFVPHAVYPGATINISILMGHFSLHHLTTDIFSFEESAVGKSHYASTELVSLKESFRSGKGRSISMPFLLKATLGCSTSLELAFDIVAVDEIDELS
mmetsp:Transcript_26639/g.29861  ORF Transcript_26639/g.29861 Transcript_26639/m.29861 type:complete len:147 (-) Transcript_26639:1338-1778(-)